MANSTAIEQQHRHLEPELACKLRVGIHIDHGDGGNGLGALEFGQRVEHVLAEAAALAAQHHEAGGQPAGGPGHLLRRWGAMPKPWVVEDFDVALTWVAMNWTVFGGTSPMAVIW